MEFDLPKDINITRFMHILRNGNLSEASRILPHSLFLMLVQTLNGSVAKEVTFNDSFPTAVTHSIYDVEPADYSYRRRLIQAYGIIILIASTAGIFGNGLVIAVYIKKLKDLSVIKLLILHLALVDFVFSISQCFLAIPSIKVSPWEYGEASCKVVHSCLLLGSLVAVGTMLIIAIERYYSIVRALTYRSQRKRVIILVLTVWILATGSTLPSTVALRLDDKQNCKELWQKSGLSRTGEVFYEFYLLIFWFVFPMIIISFCYVKIVTLLKKPLEKRGLHPWNVCPKYFSKRRKEDMKAVRTSIAVVTMFFICCSPVRILWVVLKYIDTDKIPNKNYFILLYSGLLPYPLHVVMNPLIYSLIDKLFRKDVKNLLYIGKKNQNLVKDSKETITQHFSLNRRSVYLGTEENLPDSEIQPSLLDQQQEVDLL